MVTVAACLALNSEKSFAQAPVITAVSPIVAAPGATDTIYGNHFSTTAANNIVYYGSTQAVVTGTHDSTALYVSVPYGSIYYGVSVMNSARHLTAFQPTIFEPTYDNSCFGSGNFNFSPKVDYISGFSAAYAQPYMVAVGDLDNDGRPDLAVANNNTNKIMLFKNITPYGVINGSSFSLRDSITVIGAPTNIKFADMDADGKLDLIVAIHNSLYACVIRNTSTATTISHAASANVKIAMSGSPVGNEVAIGDYDGDGRPDIAVAKEGTDSICIILNHITSVPTGTNPILATSFANYVGFLVGANPTTLYASDFDGNGTTDLAVCNYSSSNVTVLSNSSSVGSLSFSSTSYNITSGNIPLEIQAADLDGDGKADLLVTNINSTATVNYISTFKNNSTSGSMSFGTHNDISTSGSFPTGFSVGDLDGDGKPDVAIANSYSTSNQISIMKNTSSGGTIGLTYATSVTSGSSPIGVQIADLDSNGTPDIIVGNHGTFSNSFSVIRNSPVPLISAITGLDTICMGSGATTYSDSEASGTWMVTNGHATINAVTGVLTAVSVGTDTVVYRKVCLGDTAISRKTIVIVSGVTPATITGPGSVCSGDVIIDTASISGGVWGVTSATSSIASVDATGHVTGGAVTGTAQITYTLSNACGSRTSYHSVRVLAPSGRIRGTASLCTGNSTSLADSSAGGTWSSSDYAIATIGTAGIVTGSSAGSATITYTAPGGCYSILNVTVNASPAPISGSAAVCYGLSTTLTESTTGGTWSVTNTSIATIDPGSGVISGSAVGLDTVMYSDGTCTVKRPFRVNPLPTDIFGPSEFCAGSSITLSDATTSGVWSSSTTGVATVTSTGPSTASVHGISYGSSTISYTLSATGCLTTTTVYVDSVPNPITGPTAVCQNNTITLSESSSGGGTWSTSSIAIATVSSTGVVRGVSSGTVNVIYTFSTSSCATSYTVRVNRLPGAITGNAVVCPGFTETLGDTTSGGSWTTSSTSIGTVVLASGLFTGVSSGVANVTYTLYGTGCLTTANVTVNTAPAAIAGTDTICNGTATTLFESSTGGYWHSSFPAVATVDSASGVVTGRSAGTAIISFTDTISNHCSAFFPFDVRPILTPSLSLTLSTGTTNVCSGTSVLYTAHPVNGGDAPSYVWQVNGLVTGSGPTFLYSPAMGDVIQCTLTSNAYCLSTATAVTSLTMTVNPLVTPRVTLNTSTGSDTICIGSRALIIPTPVYGGSSPTFVWRVNGIPVWYGATWTYTPRNGDVVSAVMTSDVACPRIDSASDSIVLTVSPYVTPTVSITGSDTACSGYAANFVATITNGGYTPSFVWTVNGSDRGTGAAFSYMATTGDVVDVTMVSDFPCVSVATVTATPKTMTVISVPVPVVHIETSPGYLVDTGTWVTFTAHAINAGSHPTYSWFKNSLPVPSGLVDSVLGTADIHNRDSFECKVTNNDYCDGISAFGYQIMFVGANVGVSNLNPQIEAISLLPNPNTGTFILKGGLTVNGDVPMEIQVMNVLGQVVLNQSFTAVKGNIDEKISLGGALSNGVYMVNVRAGQFSKVIRFELQR